MHSKLSKTRRLPLDRLATLLVARQPIRFARDAKLLGYTLGRYAKSDVFVEKTHVMDERLALFHQIEDDVDGDDDDEDEIENGALFADALLATSCPLATPAACKHYWAEERLFDPIDVVFPMKVG